MLQSKLVLLILFYIICLSNVSSQTYNISGVVLDSENNDPIENVNVYIESLDLGTTTNNEGYFELYLNNQFADSVDLNIEMIGYKKRALHVNFLIIILI